MYPQALVEVQGSNPRPSVWRAQSCKPLGHSGLAEWIFIVIFIRLSNAVGFSDAGELWKDTYENDMFEEEVRDLFSQVHYSNINWF